MNNQTIKATLLTPLPLPKNQLTWNHINGRQLPWKKIHNSLWKAPVPNNWNQLHWLFLRKSLFLGENAAKHNLLFIPHICLQCGSPETHQHLFFHCTRAKLLWDWASVWWSKFSNQTYPPITLEHVLISGATSPIPKQDPKLLPIWQSIHRTIMWTLWITRCKEVFGDSDISDPHLFQIFKSNLKKIILFSHFIPKYHKLFTLWQKTFISVSDPHNFQFLF